MNTKRKIISDIQADVKQEMIEIYNQEVYASPRKLTADELETSSKLLIEELNELMERGFKLNPSVTNPDYEKAAKEQDLVEICDGLGDLLVIIAGVANRCGIDIYEIFNEIHRSNMTKNGGHKNEYGKFIKPKTYSPANIRGILEKHGWKSE